MLLHAIQEHFGYISQEAMEWIAAKLELQPINIYELVTFYPMFRQEPVGQISAARSAARLSCALGGSHELHEHFCEKLGLDATRTARRRRRTENSRSNLSSAWPVAAPRR